MRLFRTFLLTSLTLGLIYTGSAYSSSSADLIHQFTMDNGLLEAYAIAIIRPPVGKEE